MNILYLAHRIPYPPNKGDKMRAFRQLEYLCERHRVWCACFVDTPGDFRYVHDLRRICEDVGAIELKRHSALARGLWSLARGSSLTEGYYENREMTALLNRWQKSVPFDAVLAFSTGMANHALNVPATRRVLDLCDLDSQKWEEYATHLSTKANSGSRSSIKKSLYEMESRRLAAVELRWIDRFDASLVATAAEAHDLELLAPRRKLHVVGNGIVIPTSADPAPGYPIDGARPVVGFVGVMNYLPNVDAVHWFAQEVWPKVRLDLPDAQFRIVGRSPTREVRLLERLPGIRVTGEVPNAALEVARFDVSVAPLRIARGIQNKVLEAMAAGKPVVLTSKAAKGIQAAAGRDYSVTDDPDSIADSVLSLLKNREARDQMGDHARRFVAEHHTWKRELEKLESIVLGKTAQLEFEAASDAPRSKPKASLPLRSPGISQDQRNGEPVPV